MMPGLILSVAQLEHVRLVFNIPLVFSVADILPEVRKNPTTILKEVHKNSPNCVQEIGNTKSSKCVFFANTTGNRVRDLVCDANSDPKV